MEQLSKTELEKALATLNDWKYEEPFITKKFIFKDHKYAFAFIAKVALIAEKLNHHPNWSGVYNEVVIRLSTHDAQAVTKKDIEFATEIENAL